MKIGITYRLFLAILTATLLAVVSMILIMGWNMDRGFLSYVHGMEQKRLSRLAERLEEEYAFNGSWEYLRRDPSLWRKLVMTTQPEDLPGPPMPDHPIMPEGRVHGGEPPPPEGAGPLPPPHFGIPVFLLDAEKRPLMGPGNAPAGADLQPVRYKGRIVGYVGLSQRKNLADIRQIQFIKQQKSALSLVAVVLLLLTAGLSLPLANRLVSPIRALATATRDLTSGKYEIRVPITSTDELGRLAVDFNTLAFTLEKNEKARRQWVADISHELRTPLAVLRGEVEAIQDGIRELTPDSIQSLHGEVMRLSRLVDDLYQLSLSDLGALSYRKEDIDPAEPLCDALAMYEPEFARKGLKLTADVREKVRSMVFGDPERLRQLFDNLLDNALKYTDAGGEVVVSLACQDDQAVIDVQDSAPGVPDGSLEKLFERLYRIESSRSRAAGGAGLGLAICRNIVEAHNGSISAQPSMLGGVWLRVTLPISEISR